MDERARQPDRTALSWFRTVLGFVAVAVLALRQPRTAGGEVAALGIVLPIVIVVSAVATQRTRELRARAAAADAAGLGAPSRSAALVMMLGVVGIGLLAVVLAA